MTDTTSLELLLRRTARKHLELKEGEHWDTQISKKQAEALAPFLDEMDRNGRAYGWEIGQGRPLTRTITFSEDNPFVDKNWRDKVKE